MGKWQGWVGEPSEKMSNHGEGRELTPGVKGQHMTF